MWGGPSPALDSGIVTFWYQVVGDPQLTIASKRLGPDPHLNGAQTPGCYGCPDIWEIENGDFAVIGADITNLTPQLPPSANCGPDERMVWIPRKMLLLAKKDIPDFI